MLNVDHFEIIRREHFVEGKSIRQIARELGHGRKVIRKAIEHSTPPGYTSRRRQSRPAMAGFTSIVDAWLEADKSQHRKQRHTAMRIYERLVDEHSFGGSYPSVARYVRQVRKKVSEVYMPLYFGPGKEAQMDWGEARVELNGVVCKVQLFCLRLCYSGTSFVRAYDRQDQLSFLDGHVHAFEFIGGVPQRLAYDNLSSAVTVKGWGVARTKKPTQAFKELKSHYLFDYRFCTEARGNEKGHVENLVKYSQRHFLTPLPSFQNLDELNAYLLEQCQKDMARQATGQDKSKAECLIDEAAAFLPKVPGRFEACQQTSTYPDKMSTVRFDKCFYSVPMSYIGESLQLRGYVDRVEIYSACEQIATHPRCCDGRRYQLDFMHYLDGLERKPGWLKNGRAFLDDPWGSDFARLRCELLQRHPEDGDKRFIRVLLLLKEYSLDQVSDAVAACVKRCAFSEEVVRHELLRKRKDEPDIVLELSADSPFQTTVTGIKDASSYDALLKREAI